MATISLCMIVRDEALTLRRCLDAVKDAVDEIVIVDTGSADDTIAIAKTYTDHVHTFVWIDDFAAARNFAFSLAKMDYIFWLDADDVMEKDQAAALRSLADNLDKAVDAVMMRYQTAFDESGRPTFSFMRERLLRNGAGFSWMEPVHEYIAISGRIIQSEIEIKHMKPPGRADQKSDRNLRIYERTLLEKGQLSPRGQYYYARELMDHGRDRAAIAAFESFLRGKKGWVEDNITACLEMGRCHFRLDEPDDGARAILRSFAYDTPRAEVCCELGYLAKRQNDYRKAAFWFDLVMHLERPQQGIGFVREDDWGYVPALEGCVCHYALGEMDLARKANARAENFKPQSRAVAHNWAVLGREG